MYITDERLKENNIVVTDMHSALSRINTQFKLELITEYNDLYKQIHLVPLTNTQFEELMLEQNATIQKRVAVLHAEAAVISEIS